MRWYKGKQGCGKSPSGPEAVAQNEAHLERPAAALLLYNSSSPSCVLLHRPHAGSPGSAAVVMLHKMGLSYATLSGSVTSTQLKIVSDLGWRLTWFLHRPRIWEDLKENLKYPLVPFPLLMQKPLEATHTCAYPDS